MKILRTYLLREHLGPFVVCLFGLTAVLLLGNVLKFAELVIAKGVSAVDLLRLLIYRVPDMLSFTIPMACLIAMVLAFGRLSADYEMIAVRASGVSPARLIWPMAAVGLLLSAFMFVINDRVAPASHLAFRRQLKAIGIKQPTAYLEAGTFIKDFAPYVMFVYQIRGRTLHQVRIYEPQPNGPTRTIIAERGEFERSPGGRGVQLRLYRGAMDEWDPTRPGSFYKVAFSTYAMQLQTDIDDPQRIGKKLKEFTFRELAEERARLAAQGIETLPISLELHRKVAVSFAPLVFILFGLVFGLRLHQHERLQIYLWVLAVFLVYYLGMIGMHAAAIRGWVGPGLAMWMMNLAGALGAGLALTRIARE
ncbi:MAG TPA: LptF/LptG family permease [bacterium]